ncbi:monovalent cation/H+ antiporter subunit A [Fuscibacter oryzae]|uniref:Monovalent cation/H+ antiporter subunit A n=1 Tax=Fuscibacter oryzae TaxID=2803939 RepID=A0A8J7MMA3_9RHOB|nr:monovalent cation/H+ antiporter subunit A [Fuscibacter oryzae]MBL4926772.1 monovalent cation/H+ antiporter subunit A [Fuscibacter oryzae]
MPLFLIAALPFLGALMPGLTIRAGRSAYAVASAVFTALALFGVLQHAPAVMAGQVVTWRMDWLPQAGLALSLRLDGLGLLFAGLILGIGLLIQLYARFYLSPADPVGRFFAFLMLFQGAMLGIVLSGNILMMAVFWEMTSLSSFLLIGYWRHLPGGRQGARMALAVTGAGGLAMLAGLILLGQVTGSYELSDILAKGDLVRQSPLYRPILALILLGAFTKSAQFPFHFWLPQAMAAPTPVSAYLHSATMVKAGLFLMARLWPVLAGTPEWSVLVAGAGLVTMLLGAGVALFRTDLKAILAYSTVSHLGLITFLLGLGTEEAASAAMVHILVHASFKAALFMLAGIVDHAAHTRDIRQLGGLRRLMPVTFALALVATLSMAGIPPLNGFLSKELMLEQAAHAGTPVALAALFGAALSVAYCLRFLAGTFLGPERADYPHTPHDPGPGLWAAPALLVAVVIATGLFPMLLAPLAAAAAAAVTDVPQHLHLALWHGLGPAALWMSLGAIGLGLTLWGGWPRLSLLPAMPEAKTIYDLKIAALVALSRSVNRLVDHGRLAPPLAIASLTILDVGLWAFLTGSHTPGTRALTPLEPAPLAGFVLLVAATLGTVAFHRQRLLSLLLIGIAGLMISAFFAWAAAPDLALTQITVEVVTVLLMLLSLSFLPALTPAESRATRRLRDGLIAGTVGLGAAALTYGLLVRDFAFPTISAFHLANSKPGAGGTNAVNTIIVDFRGYDTYGEIIVLGIAALVIFALAEVLLAPGPANNRLLARRPDPARAGDRHPMMLVVVTRFLLPIALMVGVYIYLRGHNLPGGGFVAGLVVAIGFLLQYLASGHGWTEAHQRVNHHALIGAGVLVASATGIGAWLAGRPFLTSAYGYIHLPPLEEFEWATAAAFDLGVFLCVLGAVMLALASLSRLAQRGGERVAPRAHDVLSEEAEN